MHPEIGGYLLDRHTVLTIAGDPHDIVTELLGIRPCHGDILSAHPVRASELSVTYTCSRPPLTLVLSLVALRAGTPRVEGRRTEYVASEVIHRCRALGPVRATVRVFYNAG
ncbi:hypothetical protein MINTM021_11600 [Mycobacterium paraintracellulare]|nr:hypothetical protein MINTM021_11600 [Mycobacterium paraintracellulare]